MFKKKPFTADPQTPGPKEPSPIEALEAVTEDEYNVAIFTLRRALHNRQIKDKYGVVNLLYTQTQNGYSIGSNGQYFSDVVFPGNSTFRSIAEITEEKRKILVVRCEQARERIQEDTAKLKEYAEELGKISK